jgi:hypothetical protein
MKHLIAKTKGRNGDFHLVISNKNIFELPDDLENPKGYKADYKIEDDEWFAIENFSEKKYFIDFLSQNFMSTDYNQINVNDFNKIEYLCAYQSGDYYFQKLSTSQLIQKKYFSISNSPTLIENEPIIIIDNYPDAIYRKNNDTLYFKNLSTISSIFNGIDILYREATNEETEVFLQSDFILLENDFNAQKVKKANRKRIAMAIETFKKYSETQQKSIIDYIREYCDDLNFDETQSNFSIKSEEDLKKLLFGIEQRYYTTRLGDERRLANSIITL